MFKNGDKVLVTLPGSEAIVKGMRQFHGATMVVKNVGVNRGGHFDVTLYGARSAMGKDYYFMNDWLTPIDDESEAENEQ